MWSSSGSSRGVYLPARWGMAAVSAVHAAEGPASLQVSLGQGSRLGVSPDCCAGVAM